MTVVPQARRHGAAFTCRELAVKHDHVRRQRIAHLECHCPAIRLSHHDDVGLAVQKYAKADTKRRVVVHKQDTDRTYGTFT